MPKWKSYFLMRLLDYYYEYEGEQNILPQSMPLRHIDYIGTSLINKSRCGVGVGIS